MDEKQEGEEKKEPEEKMEVDPKEEKVEVKKDENLEVKKEEKVEVKKEEKGTILSRFYSSTICAFSFLCPWKFTPACIRKIKKKKITSLIIGILSAFQRIKIFSAVGVAYSFAHLLRNLFFPLFLQCYKPHWLVER